MKKSVNVFLTLALLFTILVLPVPQPVLAALAGTVVHYPLFVPGDAVSATPTSVGTPFAAYVSITGGSANTGGVIKSRQGPPAGSMTQSRSWMGTFWGDDNTSYATCLPFTTDANGNWSGWIVAKSLTPTLTPTDAQVYRPRFRIPPTSGNYDFGSVNVTRMTMTSTGVGGWVQGYAYLGGVPLAGKVVVAKDTLGQIVGAYLTENNGVEEGYTSTDTGYFKLSVPAGTGYRLELWEPSNNNLIGTRSGVDVVAGSVTTGQDIAATNPPALAWTGETGYQTGGVQPPSGNTLTSFNYRVLYADSDNDPPLAGNPKVHILKDSVEVVGSPFSMTGTGTSYTTGVIYSYSTTLAPGNYTYFFEAKDSNGSTASGPPASSSTGPSVSGDMTPPDIFSPHPARFASTYSITPTISASYQDSQSGIDISSVKIFLDDIDQTANVTITASSVTWIPTSNLSTGSHAVKVQVKDMGTNLREITWYFNVITSLVTPNTYWGDLHSHTSYSDGAGTPAQAFGYARDVAEIDFLAVTDHSNSLNDSEWADVQAQATTFTQDGTFVALPGFEWTHTQQGHVNVYTTTTYVSRDNTNYNSLAKFYAWLKNQPNAVAEFNHPFTLQDFDGFAYDAAIDQKITMQEVGNGSPPYSYARLEEAYIYALDKGWHVGATNNQDNHAANWGYPPNNLTGVVANNLTQADVLAAMRDMRTFGTEDRDLTLHFLANNYWMGTTIDIGRGETIQFHLYANDTEPGDPISTVQIITNGGRVLQSWSPNSSQFSLDYSYTNPGAGSWYYLKVIETDGNIGISSPIWTAAGDVDLRLTSFTASPLPSFPNTQTTLSAVVNNYGLFAGNSLLVSFYQGDPNAGGLPIGTATCTVAVGGAQTVSTTWTPTAGGNFSLYAVLTAPPEDPPVDNTGILTVRVIAGIGKNVMIDRYHKNDYTSNTGLYNLTKFADLLRYNGYTVMENNASITPTALADIDILVITYPQSGSGRRDMTTEEMDAIQGFVSSGGALLFAGKSNYGETNTRYNDLLISMGIGVVVNGDNIYDKSDNYGYDWSVNLRDFPPAASQITDDLSNIRFFSGASLIKPDKTPLVSDPAQNLEVLAFANATSYDEDDVDGATHVTTGYWTYSYASHPSGATMPAMAVQTLPNGARAAVLGRAIFSNYEMGQWVEGQAACNNEAFSVALMDWLCNYDRITPIGDLRAPAQNTQIAQVTLGQTVTIRGIVTAGSGTFFDVLYLQDESGGVTVFGSLPSDKIVPLGTVLQVTGVVDEYGGDLELKYADFYKDILWVGWTDPLDPTPMITDETMFNANEGWLVQTKGAVTEILDSGTCLIDDGSGPSRIFLDAYVGTLPVGLKIGDSVSVIGLTGEYAQGHRIRVRSAAEVQILNATFTLSLTEGWNLIGFPLKTASEPSVVFAGLPSGWMLCYWDPVSLRYQTNDQISLVPGASYWIRVSASADYQISGQSFVQLQQEIPLSYGWNMIGSPYEQVIPWTNARVCLGELTQTLDQAVSSGWIAGSAYGWEDYRYFNAHSAGEFTAGKGYWLNSLQRDCILVFYRP